MRKSLSVIVLLASAAVALGEATTQPTPAALEVRATSAFNRGEYVAALPLLQKLADDARAKKDDDRLGRIQEQIRVCQTQMANQAAAATASGNPDPSAAPAPAKDAGSRKPHEPVKPGETREMTIKELGNFEYDADKGGTLPEDVRKLSGAKLRLRGFMIPMDQAENITQFALVPDLFACCYGQPPQVQHTVVATAPKGKAVSYYPDELVVEGTLAVQEKKEDGFIISLFEMQVSSVKPTAK